MNTSHSSQGSPFVNATSHDFADIGSEEFREYVFPGGELVRIDSPLKLAVSESGGHRLFDRSGLSHYVPPGWVHLRWRARDGEPNFVA